MLKFLFELSFHRSKVAPREVSSYDYKAVLEAFVADTITTSALAEWPVAHLVMKAIVVHSVSPSLPFLCNSIRVYT